MADVQVINERADLNCVSEETMLGEYAFNNEADLHRDKVTAEVEKAVKALGLGIRLQAIVHLTSAIRELASEGGEL